MLSTPSVTAVAVIITTLVHIASGAAIATFLKSGSAMKTNLTSGSATSSAISSAYRAFREVYTTNAICRKKNCINPVFPGMEDLHRLEQATWITSSLQKTNPSMGFCKSAITYDPALPVPLGGGERLDRLVQRQDNAAATTFYYHVYALGLEAWDYPKPEFADDCIKSIWRMACFTYFPRAEVGTADGAYSRYLRPCQSSCTNYVAKCNVECCDESVQCVFSHTKEITHTQNVTTQGYLPHDGPSSFCTGGAGPSARLGLGLWALIILKALFSFDVASSAGGLRSLFGGMGRRSLIIVCVAVASLSLQGCAYDVPIHRVGNWRASPDYLIQHEFVPPGGSAKQAGINSCSLLRLSQSLQCSGRGVCRVWNPTNHENPLAFCECDRGWADPECRTARKSQTVAYLLSMFFGMFGADQFYLGFTGTGVAKLLTFGGCGVWWIVDIVRIGSAPVYSHNFRTAADLPHGAFVLSVVMWAGFLGFAVTYVIVTTHRARKRKEAMLLSESEEHQRGQSELFADAYRTKMTRKHGDGHGNVQQQFVQSTPTISHSYKGAPGSGYAKMPVGYPSMGGMRMP